MKLDSKDYTPSDLLDLFCFDLAYGTNSIDSLLNRMETKALHDHHKLIDSLDFMSSYINSLGDRLRNLRELTSHQVEKRQTKPNK